MKTRLLTLLFALTTSVGAIYGDLVVTIGDLRYILNEETKTAEVTYKYLKTILGVSHYNKETNYTGTFWNIETANIPSIIEYEGEAYSVIGIGEHAFENCDSLRSITIPSSITTIKYYAFHNCNNLSAIHIPDIAAWCTNNFKDSNPLALAHNLYLNDELITDLVIPEGVTSISEKAFYDCDNITSVIIPGSVTCIGKDAFRYCNKLKSAVIGYCGNTNVETTNNFMSIENYAFDSRLDTVIIGKNVANIEKYAFSDGIHSYVKSVTLYSDTLVGRTYSRNNDIGNLFGDSVQNYVIGEGIKNIGKYAFYNRCSNVTSITFPKSLTNVAAYAFSGCYNLEAVHISDLASWCLVNFTSEGSWTTYRIYNPLISAHNLYLNDELITDLVIPKGVTSIREGVFCGGNFNSIFIPSNVTNIGQYAFYSCDSLTSVTFATPHLSIGKNAFYKCANLNAMYTTDIALWCNIDFDNLYSNPLSIAHNFYLNRALVTDLVIPENVTNIRNYVFCGFSNLSSVSIPSSVKNIGNGAFYECTSLSSIKIPNSVTYIGDEAFAWCTSMISIELPDSLTTISYACFSLCEKLAAITLPKGITSIGHYAFNECKRITDISIPEGVTSIGGSAFRSTGLSSVTLPSSLKGIGIHVFVNCEQLEAIILLAEVPPTFTGQNPGSNKFAEDVPIYIPCGTLEVYMGTDWNMYNLQYQPNIYELNVSSSDTLKGYVNAEGNICANILSAKPIEGNYFVQWSDGSTENPRTITLTQDTTITAIFATQTFTVMFVDDNDTVLSLQEYEYGSLPIPPTDPVKTNDAQYSYTFAGWSPRIVAVTRDATYKATYTSTLNKYTITFMSEDSVLSTDLWEYGTMPVYRGGTPTKAEDGEYVYTFNGWIPEIVSVVADATYTATFTATPKPEAIEDVMDNSIMPTKHVENGKIYILMPNGKKYSIIGELVK